MLGHELTPVDSSSHVVRRRQRIGRRTCDERTDGQTDRLADRALIYVMQHSVLGGLHSRIVSTFAKPLQCHTVNSITAERG